MKKRKDESTTQFLKRRTEKHKAVKAKKAKSKNPKKNPNARRKVVNYMKEIIA
jgi:hypothetical protein